MVQKVVSICWYFFTETIFRLIINFKQSPLWICVNLNSGSSSTIFEVVVTLSIALQIFCGVNWIFCWKVTSGTWRWELIVGIGREKWSCELKMGNESGKWKWELKMGSKAKVGTKDRNWRWGVKAGSDLGEVKAGSDLGTEGGEWRREVIWELEVGS